MCTTFEILVPVDQTEGTRSQVLRWLRSIGDPVNKHEPLLEIETDKATVEVAAPVAGILREILKAEQDEVLPGDVLGRLEPIAQPDARTHQHPGLPSIGSPVLSAVLDERAPGAEVDATGQHRERVRGRPATAIPTGAVKSLSASPAVQRLVKERNLDIATIRGTGEDGRITVDDVLSHKDNSILSAPAQERTVRSDPDREIADSSPVGVRSIPHTAIRKRIAANMVQSLLHTAPHVTGAFEADLSNVVSHLSNHVVEFGQRGVPLTHTAYFLAATVKAIREVPESNSRWTDSALEIYEPIHVGIATNVKGTSLVVPVIRNVESLDLFGIAEGLYKLVTTARQNNLRREDVSGGTFTISNHGFLFASPIVIKQPQSAILGVGIPEKRAVVIEQAGKDAVVVRHKCYVTLTFDHRVMDGYRASRFLETFIRTLREWPPD